jgi:dCMP deaminase
MMNKWDTRFLDLAALVASWSKDPSTKVGAVIVRPDRTVASLGYNGFPRGVADTESRYEDRETKYQLVVHAEANAIISAGESVKGMTMYGTLFPCCDCAKLIIQAGIQTLVVPQADRPERYAESMAHADQMFFESGVLVRPIRWNHTPR